MKSSIFRPSLTCLKTPCYLVLGNWRSWLTVRSKQ